MSRVLLDENVPIGVIKSLVEHDVHHVAREGWDGSTNGALIARAEREGYEGFVTADESLRYQQNLRTRRLSLVILNTNKWPVVRASLERIANAVERAVPGGFQELDVHQTSRDRGVER